VNDVSHGTPNTVICPASGRARSFKSFSEAVGPFVNDIEEMRHYQVTLSSDA
jgi:hypothetical protein